MKLSMQFHWQVDHPHTQGGGWGGVGSGNHGGLLEGGGTRGISERKGRRRCCGDGDVNLGGGTCPEKSRGRVCPEQGTGWREARTHPPVSGPRLTNTGGDKTVSLPGC